MYPPAGEPRKTCHLCGLGLGASPVLEKTQDGTIGFCCPGCRQVFLLLSAAAGVLPERFRETELYRVCLESGIIRPDGPPPRNRDSGPLPPDLPPLEATYRVEGMWCPSCAWLIEEVMRRTAGVIEPAVSFASDTARLTYLPHKISPSEIASRIARLGYRLSTPDEATARQEKGSPLFNLGLSTVLTANIMMISLALYAGFFREFPPRVIAYFSYPLFVMTTIVLFWCGRPILRRGWAALRYRSPSMDTLVSAGALASYLLSSLQMLRHTLHLYFDTASMLVTFVLFGAYLERRARDRISAGIAGLYRMAQGKIRIVEGGREKWVDAEMARPKDRFMVLSGETIPLDSRVVGGSGLVDESLLTGEARPRPKGPGDPVIGGSTVRDGQMTLEAVHTADGSTVRQIIDRVEEALSGKDTHELLADRISRLFIPVVFAVAGATALACGLSDASLDEALLRCLTVVLISCPCALGIAIPLVKVAVIGLARKKGVHVRESGALERMKDLDTIVFDKTGTLTEGTYALEAVIGGGLDDRTILSRLAAIEVASPHFLAREIVREAARRGGRPLQAQAVEAVPGLGVKGRVEGVETCLGNRRFMEGCGFFLPDAMDREAASWEKRGRTTAFFAWERSVRGFLIFGDPVRPGANEAVRLLCERGIDVWLISGDARTTTEAVAESLGITRFAGQALPAEKVDHIRRLQDEGRRVGMVGDGLNDAAALAQADVGCAFGPASGTLRNASDITFLSPDPRKLLDAIALSALATRTMRQNLFFAFSYNAVAIPVAALGLLNPLIAVLAMFASSLVVTANALRISSADPS